MPLDPALAALPAPALALLEQLCADDARRAPQLRAVAHACAHILTAGGEVTVARVASLAAPQGAPSARTMYNPAGLSYRRLIKACGAGAGTVRAREVRRERVQSLSDRLPPSPLRAEVRALEADYHTVRQQLVALKALAPGAAAAAPLSPAPELDPMQRRALEAALSKEAWQRRGWRAQADGSVLGDRGERIFLPSFVDAIEKVLGRRSGAA